MIRFIQRLFCRHSYDDWYDLQPVKVSMWGKRKCWLCGYEEYRPMTPAEHRAWKKNREWLLKSVSSGQAQRGAT